MTRQIGGGHDFTSNMGPSHCGGHMGTVVFTLEGDNDRKHWLPAGGTKVELLTLGMQLTLSNKLSFLCAVFLCPRPFLGGPRQEFFPVSFHVLVVSPCNVTFSPYGAKLRTQQPRQFFSGPRKNFFSLISTCWVVVL